MFGFLAAWKARKSQEKQVEAEKRLKEMRSVASVGNYREQMSAAIKERGYGYQNVSSSAYSYLQNNQDEFSKPMGLLNPMNPLSPISQLNPINYSSPTDCSPSTSSYDGGSSSSSTCDTGSSSSTDFGSW